MAQLRFLHLCEEEEKGSSNNYRVALCNIHWKGREMIKRHKIRSRRCEELKIRWEDLGERFEVIVHRTRCVDVSRIIDRFWFRIKVSSAISRWVRRLRRKKLTGRKMEQCHYRGCFQIKRPPPLLLRSFTTTATTRNCPQPSIVPSIKLIDIPVSSPPEIGIHHLFHPLKIRNSIEILFRATFFRLSPEKKKDLIDDFSWNSREWKRYASTLCPSSGINNKFSHRVYTNPKI